MLLDPVYTAKALAALIADVRAGRYRSDQALVFIHTGGTPALFAYAGDLERMLPRVVHTPPAAPRATPPAAAPGADEPGRV